MLAVAAVAAPAFRAWALTQAVLREQSVLRVVVRVQAQARIAVVVRVVVWVVWVVTQARAITHRAV